MIDDPDLQEAIMSTFDDFVLGEGVTQKELTTAFPGVRFDVQWWNLGVVVVVEYDAVRATLPLEEMGNWSRLEVLAEAARVVRKLKEEGS